MTLHEFTRTVGQHLAPSSSNTSSKRQSRASGSSSSRIRATISCKVQIGEWNSRMQHRHICASITRISHLHISSIRQSRAHLPRPSSVQQFVQQPKSSPAGGNPGTVLLNRDASPGSPRGLCRENCSVSRTASHSEISQSVGQHGFQTQIPLCRPAMVRSDVRIVRQFSGSHCMYVLELAIFP